MQGVKFSDSFPDQISDEDASRRDWTTERGF